MPQINRIRVNNVKYNFGTQIYDDFVMRFSCRNTIYDLANGGGKSVLMLLLLQNLIPNCTLDDKQPVEKLFRTAGASTTIHSLIEWKLDVCDVKDGFRYMTTGFCARKGKETTEDEKNGDSATIDYFNYCIFYREFGHNDIKNLPLTKNNERITYNGLKAYLRDLEKNDFGVRVYVFDRKSDYQNFISRYGLYESQWEIVRGINKTEGHVRTYFENNYRTTRKVVEDLLIEEIIEKSYNNRIKKTDTDHGEMAQTLLDIKDKLTELSKRKSEIGNYNTQIELLRQFGGELDNFTSVYEQKAALQKELVDCYIILKDKLAKKQQQIAQAQEKYEKLQESHNFARKQAKRAEVGAEYVELDKLNALIKDTETKIQKLDNRKKQSEDKLRLSLAACEYTDYLENSRKYAEIKELINSRDYGMDEIMKELAALSSARKLYVDERQEALNEQIATANQRINDYDALIEEKTNIANDIFASLNAKNGIAEALKEELASCDKEIDAIMKENDILFSENAGQLCDKTKEAIVLSTQHIDSLQKDIADNETSLKKLNQDIVLADYNISQLNKKLEELNEEKNRQEALHREAGKLKDIYGGDFNNVEKIYDATVREEIDLKKTLKEYESYKDTVRNRTFPEYNGKFIQLYNYLKERYGDDILSGKEVLAKLPDGGINYIKEHPYAPYVIFAGDSYEQILNDTVVSSMALGTCIIPIFKNMETQPEDAIYACKKLAFMWDDTALSSELNLIDEEITRITHEADKTSEKCRVIWDDLMLIRQADREKYELLNRQINDINGQLEDAMKDREESDSSSRALNYTVENERKSLESEENNLASLKDRLLSYEKLEELCKKAALIGRRIKENDALATQLKTEFNHTKTELEAMENSLAESRAGLEKAEFELHELLKEFADNFEPYYNPDVPPSTLSQDEICAKAGAYNAIIRKEQGDIEDKQQLLATYNKAMEKCARSIKYNKMSLEEAGKLYDEGALVDIGETAREALKNTILSMDKNYAQLREEFDAQNAQKNRIEGGIGHAISTYESEFGMFEPIESENPQADILRFRQDVSNYKKQLLDCEKEKKELENSDREHLFAIKDLERILKGWEITVGENAVAQNLNPRDYELLQKEIRNIAAGEDRLRNAFINKRHELALKLSECNAYELAREVEENMEIPENAPKAAFIKEGLEDTIKCIELERDRIDKSMSEYRQIQDSFVERCIQICQNIKTELDRLPKLSRITLDDQIIPIITMTIPYIREDMYKDRMTVYINETVAGADSFKDNADKLKYIKNHLSWKKLFSVIVTDMSGIKLCLYKREHIKDQSRYLKYEEAVGSTGQSQGIYIQFLIAIINYISNINAIGKDNGVVGKTIFIDNPFGAAKDVYIWEPIFKMLATNHVQLIVPARGVTPAITKMFDVNYILGQKMAAGKQQTVVVDYRSEVQVDEMDYNELDYEQATFDFL